MIARGMQAVAGAADPGQVEDFNAASAWQSSLVDYNGCPRADLLQTRSSPQAPGSGLNSLKLKPSQKKSGYGY